MFQQRGHEGLDVLPPDVRDTQGHSQVDQVVAELFSSAQIGIEGLRTQVFGPDVSAERIDIDALVAT